MFNIGDKLTEENYTEGAIWCNENNATIEEVNGEYIIKAIPEPLPPTKKETQILREKAYRNEVDPLMSQYTRKKIFGLFEDGEEEALLAEIEAKVAEIKENNPYPASAEPVKDNNNTIVELYSMEI